MELEAKVTQLQEDLDNAASGGKRKKNPGYARANASDVRLTSYCIVMRSHADHQSTFCLGIVRQ